MDWKRTRYNSLAAKCYFVPVAVETLGALGEEAKAFISDLGRRHDRGATIDSFPSSMPEPCVCALQGVSHAYVLYVERIRDFFGLCAIQIYFLLTYLLTRRPARHRSFRHRNFSSVGKTGRYFLFMNLISVSSCLVSLSLSH